MLDAIICSGVAWLDFDAVHVGHVGNVGTFLQCVVVLFLAAVRLVDTACTFPIIFLVAGGLR